MHIVMNCFRLIDAEAVVPMSSQETKCQTLSVRVAALLSVEKDQVCYIVSLY